MSTNPLSELAMWKDWQRRVVASLPNFAGDGHYLEQKSYLPEFEEVARYVAARPHVDLDGQTRDQEFGAIVVDTKALGPVTRAWLDANVEIDFLERHMGLANRRVLDIGAGYGRLAAVMWRIVDEFWCVDAVPISTELCRRYCDRFAAGVQVLDVDEFVRWHHCLSVDLAINIHSWNECSLEQVKRWLEMLKVMRVPWLFTVSHGQLDARRQRAYYTWGNGGPSFRPLLEADFELVAEESIGLGSHPHALWRRR